MDAESRILLQEIDCNCNDCAFFVRSLDRLNESKRVHRGWVAAGIRTRRAAFWAEAQKALGKGDMVSYHALLKERRTVSVDRSYKAGLIFGDCSKKGARITTVPGTCLPENAECFVHRKRVAQAAAV